MNNNNFYQIKTLVQKQFSKMAKNKLFIVNADRESDELWNHYLNSFPNPDVSNPIFRERREYDCSCCRSFIRNYGGIVSIENNELVSIWDIDLTPSDSNPLSIVCRSMANLVKSKTIQDVFLPSDKNLGLDKNPDKDNPKIIWDHFYCEVPSTILIHRPSSIPAELSKYRSSKDVFKRGLDELKIDAFLTVLELIDQNSLYRGKEFRPLVSEFLQYLKTYQLLDSESKKDNYAWLMSLAKPSIAHFRNSAIGTLVVNLSEDEDLDLSVRKFESIVAPVNYKRPTALVSKSMIQEAQKTVENLGIEASLKRRHANLNDITIQNLLFANRDTKVSLNVFDEMVSEVKDSISDKQLSKIEDVTIQQFINDILPKASSIELEMENRHINNLVSLIAPVNSEAPNILKWNNNFSWTYNGSLTDSIKERVKKAGGNVTGVLRCSGEWFNYDDLDIHVVEPNGNHIHFSNKINHRTGGHLDVDMNISPTTREAVENITWPDKNKMLEGQYRFFIHNYTPRESVDVGFNAEIEFDGKVYSFSYDKKVVGNVDIATFEFSKKDGIKIISSLPQTKSSKEIWGVHTNKFNNVKAILRSPNHWDNSKEVGNLHWFFILEDCKNPDSIRGLFNEYLIQDLDKHRKVFEILGSKIMVDYDDNQLSGLGFSETKRDSILCRVRGSFQRIIRINF